MKGKTGVSMQGIEHRKPKTFNGKKAVFCKECSHLDFNIENVTMPTKASYIKKNKSKKQIYPYVCAVKKIGLFYTSKVVCGDFKEKP